MKRIIIRVFLYEMHFRVVIMEILEHVGERIRLFRKHQNLTLEELAYIIHKSPSTLCKYERGSVNIDILTLSEIANALDVDISHLTRTVTTSLSVMTASMFTTCTCHGKACFRESWKSPVVQLIPAKTA